MEEFVSLAKTKYADRIGPNSFCGTEVEWQDYDRLRKLDAVRYAEFKKQRRTRWLRERHEAAKHLTTLYREFFVRAVLAEQGGGCFWCAAPLTHVGECEVDHVMPVSKGGRSARENLAIVCLPCNRAKGDTDPDEFATLVFGDLL